MNVHFICRGNVLRSLIAETYLTSLNLPGVSVLSSGTNVNWNDPKEHEYFSNTLALLKKHGIEEFAKAKPEQLTEARITGTHDTVVFMNDRVLDEAKKIITIPTNSFIWGIVDIGEGSRLLESSRESYEEEIYQEITQKVDALVKTL